MCGGGGGEIDTLETIPSVEMGCVSWHCYCSMYIVYFVVVVTGCCFVVIGRRFVARGDGTRTDAYCSVVELNFRFFC